MQQERGGDAGHEVDQIVVEQHVGAGASCALLALRETRGMGVALAIHLGSVLAFFLAMPYGKFVHGLYRFAALVRFHIERRRPLPDVAGE